MGCDEKRRADNRIKGKGTEREKRERGGAEADEKGGDRGGEEREGGGGGGGHGHVSASESPDHCTWRRRTHVTVGGREVRKVSLAGDAAAGTDAAFRQPRRSATQRAWRRGITQAHTHSQGQRNYTQGTEGAATTPTAPKFGYFVHITFYVPVT